MFPFLAESNVIASRQSARAVSLIRHTEPQWGCLIPTSSQLATRELGKKVENSSGSDSGWISRLQLRDSQPPGQRLLRRLPARHRPTSN